MSDIQYICQGLNDSSLTIHTHLCWEMIYCKDGYVDLSVGDQKLSCKPHQAILIPPNVKHTIAKHSDQQNFVRVLFSGSFNTNDAVIIDDITGDLENILAFACKWAFISVQSKGDMMNFLSNVIKLAVDFLLSCTSKNPAVINIAFDIISNMSNPQYDIDSSFDKQALSKDYLRRQFIKEQGISPVQFLTNIRIESAKRLLQCKVMQDFKINEIALLCGFEDQLYFSRVFHKIVGMSPREWANKE